MQGMLPSVTLWFCQCCTLMHANGECCASDEHGGDGIEPLSEIPYGADVTMGMAYEEHADGCPNRLRLPAGEYHECGCEQREFSTRSCDGCGSSLAGTRHAFIIWTPAANGTCPRCGDYCFWANRTESGVDWFKCGNRECATHYTQEELVPVPA